MRTLDELICSDDPAMPLVQQWIAQSGWAVEILSPSEDRAEILTALQTTTRSPMGAIAYETGGILIDHGWLRILGSGHPKLPRNIVEWNSGRSAGHLLVADDVIGGFFSINGGAFGEDRGGMYYWAPDTLNWEALEVGYTDFLIWALSDNLATFYEDFRWPKWETEVQHAAGDQCFNFYPFLWTNQGSVSASARKLINVSEQYAFNANTNVQKNAG